MADEIIILAGASAQQKKSGRSKEYWRRHSAAKNARAVVLLGTSTTVAGYRLRKSILFSMVKRLGEDICYRCGKTIDHIDDLTIDHKADWREADDPKVTFFDLENIAFSHFLCNTQTQADKKKIYPDVATKSRVNNAKNVGKRVAANKARRGRLRAAGLPYT